MDALQFCAHLRCECGVCAESSLTQPQMVVMSDTEEPFVPLPGDLLVNLTESRVVVEALLDSLPTTFVGNVQVLRSQQLCHQACVACCAPDGLRWLMSVLRKPYSFSSQPCT